VKLSNPQSLNRYAYALNNPTTLRDPSGLYGVKLYAECDPIICGSSGHWDFTGGAYDVIFGNDIFDALAGAPGYSVYNTPTGLGFGFDPNSSALLPYYYEAAVTLNGQTYTGQFATFDQYADWLTGLAAEPQNNPGYLDALNNQLNAAIDALEAEGATRDQIMAFVTENIERFDEITLQGGNFEFFGANDIFAGFSTLPGCTGGRCDVAGIGTLDLSTWGHTANTVHLDTANPYTGLAGLVLHGFVDFFLGNFWYTFIPRPWP
jgi:hypothetical protein